MYLLIHGFHSVPDTWNDVASVLFGGVNKCPEFNKYTTTIPKRNCYRYRFPTTIERVTGETWPDGDGLTFDELGDNIKIAVDTIQSTIQPESIVLVGHSRGGLAARAYLQKLSEPTPFKLGLLTIGTPHQGSPLGRVQRWLIHDEGLTVEGIPETIPITIGTQKIQMPLRNAVKFLFSPSLGYLATAHDVNKKLSCDPNDVTYAFSKAVCELNSGIPNLATHVSVFGQMTSRGLRLGENVYTFGPYHFHLLHRGASRPLAYWLVSDVEQMTRFILDNIGKFRLGVWVCGIGVRPNDWACNGDGIVPWVSQRLTQVPGFTTTVETQVLNRVFHTNELSGAARITTIRRVLKRMTRKVKGFTPP